MIKIEEGSIKEPSFAISSNTPTMARASRAKKRQRVKEEASVINGDAFVVEKSDAVEEETSPPVIYRWQDLPPDDLSSSLIIVSCEDNYAPRGKVKLKRKEKEEEPQLFNYIYMSDMGKFCKLCPNLDWHPTFWCPNLTAGLQERLAETRKELGKFKASNPALRFCHLCTGRDHYAFNCSYDKRYPAGAPVGPLAEFYCLCCGMKNAHDGEPGVDWEARCELKPLPCYPAPDDLPYLP